MYFSHAVFVHRFDYRHLLNPFKLTVKDSERHRKVASHFDEHTHWGERQHCEVGLVRARE